MSSCAFFSDASENIITLGSLDADGNSVLHLAAQSNNAEGLKNFVDIGTNLLNLQNKRGETALHRAAIFKSVEVVGMLIDAGADVNLKDQNLETALHQAIYSDSAEIVKMLVNCGADVNLQNRYGKPPLHSAVFGGNIEIIKSLINGGADVDLQNEKYGHTALHLAAIFANNVNIIKLLVESGADTTLQDKFGQTALDIIANHNNANIRNMLHKSDVAGAF